MAKVRIVKFFLSCVHSDNCLIRNVSKCCMYQTFSNMGRNISHINMEFDYILHRQSETDERQDIMRTAKILYISIMIKCQGQINASIITKKGVRTYLFVHLIVQ